MKKLLNYFFPIPTSEQKVNRRTLELFAVLNSQTEYVLNDLEKVQVLNNLRRFLNESLTSKKNKLIEDAVNANLSSSEVQNAINHIE